MYLVNFLKSLFTKHCFQLTLVPLIAHPTSGTPAEGVTFFSVFRSGF